MSQPEARPLNLTPFALLAVLLGFSSSSLAMGLGANPLAADAPRYYCFPTLYDPIQASCIELVLGLLRDLIDELTQLIDELTQLPDQLPGAIDDVVGFVEQTVQDPTWPCDAPFPPPCPT